MQKTRPVRVFKRQHWWDQTVPLGSALTLRCGSEGNRMRLSLARLSRPLCVPMLHADRWAVCVLKFAAATLPLPRPSQICPGSFGIRATKLNQPS